MPSPPFLFALLTVLTLTLTLLSSLPAAHALVPSVHDLSNSSAKRAGGSHKITAHGHRKPKHKPHPQSVPQSHSGSGSSTRALGKRSVRKRCAPPPQVSALQVSTTTSTHHATTSSTSTHHTTSTSSHKASPTPKPSPSPSPKPPSTSSNGNRKVGIAWENAVPGSLHFWDKSTVGGLYTWSPQCPPEAAQVGIPCFPMFWGTKDASAWNALDKSKYSTAIGCNEVNQDGQSEMSPSQAASVWRTYLAPLKKSHGYRLISHSVTNAPTGLTWFQEYMKACPDCWSSTDYVNLHYYGTDGNAFIQYVTNMHNQLKKPIWVTEVACEDFSGRNQQCSASQVVTFLKTITHWMDQTEWIGMYFWFGMNPGESGGVNPDNALMNRDGSPNQLGLDYLAED